MEYKNSSKSEIFLSLVSVWWAFSLIVNTHLFDNVPELYSGLANVAGQTGWAVVFVFSATIKIIGIIGDIGALRKLGLTISMTLYALICAGYILSGAYLNTDTGVYFAITLLAIWRLREVKILYAGRVARSKGKV